MKRTVFITVLSLLVWTGVAEAKRLTVAGSRANVRAGPGKNYEILWSAGQYYPVDIIKTSGNWYQIRDFEGDVGWMHRSLLRQIPAVIVTGSVVNIRRGAGTNFPVLFQAEKGVSFKLLKKGDDWLKVEHADGEVGWIHKSLTWGD